MADKKPAEGYTRTSVDIPDDMDPVLRDRLLNQLRGPVTTIVGGIADLQRMGAQAVGGGSEGEVFQVHPDQDASDAQPVEDVNAPGPAFTTADTDYAAAPEPQVDETEETRAAAKQADQAKKDATARAKRTP